MIDPEFLAWAYHLRSTSSIARFLGVSRGVVRAALLEYEIAAPQDNPFPEQSDSGEEIYQEFENEGDAQPGSDDILDPHTAPLPHLNSQASRTANAVVSYTGPLSTVTDDELDTIVSELRGVFPRAGITMIDGMLRTFDIRIPRERIRFSLNRVDPVYRVFDRIRIRRRTYSVPGPNSLWHHDGQHGE